MRQDTDELPENPPHRVSVGPRSDMSCSITRPSQLTLFAFRSLVATQRGAGGRRFSVKALCDCINRPPKAVPLLTLARMKLAAITLGSALIVSVAACGSSTGTSSLIRTEHVSKATFAGKWPVTSESGTLACDQSKGGSITFSPDGSQDIYAENGTAMDWAAKEGWKEFHDIWLADPTGAGPRVDASDFDAEGHRLCGDNSTVPTSAANTATTASSVPSASPQPLPPAHEATLRGFLSKAPFWDQTYGPAAAADCTSQGFDGMTPIRAWRLPGEALVCAGNPDFGAWDGRVVNVSLYFDPPVDAQTALQGIAHVLPTDSQVATSTDGHNPSWSKIPDGTCEDVIFTSDALAAAESQVLPTWTGDPHKVSVTLYSGNETSDGSDQTYPSGSVHSALVGLYSGGDNNGC
jgi:Protein of unknown function (DUF2511)